MGNRCNPYIMLVQINPYHAVYVHYLLTVAGLDLDSAHT
jgi:hypothetical protein